MTSETWSRERVLWVVRGAGCRATSDAGARRRALGAGAQLGGSGLRSADGTWREMTVCSGVRPCPWGACLGQVMPWRWEREEEASPSQGCLQPAQRGGPELGVEAGVQPPGTVRPGRPGHEPSRGAARRLLADTGPCWDTLLGRPRPAWLSRGGRPGGFPSGPERQAGWGSPFPRARGPPLRWLVCSGPQRALRSCGVVTPKFTTQRQRPQGRPSPIALLLSIITTPHRTLSSSRACAMGKGQASP